MGYPESYRIPQADTRDPFLRECLRCVYYKGDRTLRLDFPPDLILKDQEPPDLILKDEITGEFWAIAFGDEIVVTPSPDAVSWRNGVWLNSPFNMRMRNGELVVSTEPLPEPTSNVNVLAADSFHLDVVFGELRYTPPLPLTALMRDLVTPGTWWNVAFGPDIVVSPGSYADEEITGITLNAGWEMQVWNGEIINIQVASVGPWLQNSRKEVLDLAMVNDEMVYRYRKRGVGPDFFWVTWAIYFREEITVLPWPYPIPYNALILAPESPTWVWEMRAGEIVLEENIQPPVPYLSQKPDRWRFGLEMINGELVYLPFREGNPYERPGNLGVIETHGVIPLEYGAEAA